MRIDQNVACQLRNEARFFWKLKNLIPTPLLFGHAVWRPGCILQKRLVAKYIMAAMLLKTSWMRKESKPIFFAAVTYAWTIMGSSKKHKEKDKDRDRERRREKERKHRDKDRERDRDSEKEKSSRRREERSREKRSHGSEEDVARVDKKKAKREDYDDLYEYAMEESARDDHESSKSQ